MAVNAGREYFQAILKNMANEGCFDRVLGKINVLSAGNGSMSAVMKVEKEHTNFGGTLHGGLTSTIVDVISGLALMTNPNMKSSGVSLALNISFLKAAPIGQEILIRATTDRVGRRVAFLSVDILNKASGDIVAKGTHTKMKVSNISKLGRTYAVNLVIDLKMDYNVPGSNNYIKKTNLHNSWSGQE